jgi:hypothetical protein
VLGFIVKNLGVNLMKPIKIKILQVASTTALAFIVGSTFQWLIGEHAITSSSASLGAAAIILAIVVAFALREHQMHALWESALQTDIGRSGRRKEAVLAMATTAWKAIEQLDFQYRDTHEDRLRIRAVYHSDTFGSLIEALGSIPAYEIEPTEAAIALAGLKKNLNEIWQAVDMFMAGGNRPHADVLFLNALPVLDLRASKSYAELHYRKLMACCQE